MTEYPSQVDTIVIGGGTAGAAMAGRLAERGDQSVLLLEAGPDYGPFHRERWPDDLASGRVVAATHDWGYTNQGRTGQPNHPLQRARVLGGCSAHNGCVALWGHRADYDGWAALGNDGWSMAELLPFFQQANAQLGVRRFVNQEVTPFHSACLEAIAATGVPQVADLNDVDNNVGVSTSPVNMHNAVRWNSAFAYLDPLRSQGYLSVIGETLVDKLQVKMGRVVGVEVIGPQGRATIATGRVILCAGAYGSPAILLRSGIGSSQALAFLGITTQIDLPGVGHNLHDHPALYPAFRGRPAFNEAMNAFVAAGHTLFTEQSLAKMRSDYCTSAFDLHLYPCSAAAADATGAWEFVMPIANMTPLSRGSVTLRSSDPTVAPIIDTGYLTDPADQDIAVLMSGIAKVRHIVQQSPLVELLEPAAPDQLDDTNKERVRNQCLHYYHPVGSCKMGPAGDAQAVVDNRGKVYGLDNLLIADASIIPVIPRANTNLPALMIAERIAAWQ